MSEYVTRIIKIELLRDHPGGRMTCATTEKACAMLMTARMGTVVMCSETGEYPERETVDGLPVGPLRPTPGCKISAEYEEDCARGRAQTDD